MYLQPTVGLVLALAGAACGMEGMGMSTAQMGETHDALTTRAENHYSACMAGADLPAMRAETAAYHDEMDLLSGDMMAGCEGMMGGSGNMSCCSTSQMGSATQEMLGEVSAHHQQMDEMSDVPTMHVECSDHHQAMGDMLDRMQSMMD